jgi:hypothetical protein
MKLLDLYGRQKKKERRQSHTKVRKNNKKKGRGIVV